MGAQPLIILIPVTGVVGLLVLVAFFRYRVSDVLFLGAAVMPMVWLSRLHEYSIIIGESTFVLLWGAFALLFLLGLISGHWQTGQLVRRPTHKVALWLGILVGLMMLSNIVNSSDGNDVIRGVNAVLFVVLPFLAAWSAARWCRMEDAGIQRTVLTLLLTGNLLALMSIVTAIMPGVVSGMGLGVTYRTYGYTRAYSPLGGANGTGMILVMVYCVAFGQLLAGRQRLISALTLVSSFLALLTTLARGALIGFVIANVFLLVWQRHGAIRRLLIASALGIFLLIPLAYKLNQYYTLERLNLGRGDLLADRSAAGRLETLKASLHYGMNHLFLGGGWGLVYDKPRIRYAYRPGSAGRTFALGGHLSLATPHSLPALVLVESGGPALLVLGCFAWSMWRSLSAPDPRVSPEGAGLVHGFRAGVLGFMVVSLVQDNLFLADRVAYCFYLFFFTGLAVATYYKTAMEHVDALAPSMMAHSLGQRPGAAG